MKKDIEEKESSSETNDVGLAFEDVYGDEEVERYEDLRTLFSQDYEAWKEAQKRGLDVKGSFRVLRLGNENENPHYHIFSTEGSEREVQEELNIMNRTRFLVDNKAVERFRVGEEDRELFLKNREKWRKKRFNPDFEGTRKGLKAWADKKDRRSEE